MALGLLFSCPGSSRGFSGVGGFNQGKAVMALGPCLVAFLAMAGVNTVQNFRGRINSTVTDNTPAVLPGVPSPQAALR